MSLFVFRTIRSLTVFIARGRCWPTNRNNMFSFFWLNPVFPLWWSLSNNSYSFFISWDILNVVKVSPPLGVVQSSFLLIDTQTLHSPAAPKLQIYRKQMTLGASPRPSHHGPELTLGENLISCSTLPASKLRGSSPGLTRACETPGWSLAGCPEWGKLPQVASFVSALPRLVCFQDSSVVLCWYLNLYDMEFIENIIWSSFRTCQMKAQQE